jgi:hypothetical protein
LSIVIITGGSKGIVDTIIEGGPYMRTANPS